MTLRDLRETIKAAYPAARMSFASMTSDNANMRQFWVEVDGIKVLNDSLPGSGILYADLVKFHRAGLIYYHAKKHGIQSAMLLKLQLV